MTEQSQGSNQNDIEATIKAKTSEVCSTAQSSEQGAKGEIRNKDSFLFVAKDLSSSVFKAVKELRDEGKLFDVVLVVQDEKISAHKLVLAASSSYFRSMFAGDMLESRSSLVELKDVEPEAMKLLVDFSYSSQLEITTDNVLSVIAASSIFDFPLILEAASKFLSAHLHPSNCLGMRSLGVTYGSDSLVSSATWHFRNHFVDAVKSEEFLAISPEVLAKLLDSDEVNVRGEEDVFKAIEIWLNHEPETRKDSLPAVLTHVRLPLLSLDFLRTNVESNHYIRRNLECRDILDEAKDFHLFPDDYSMSKGTRFHPRKSTVGVLFAIGGRGAVGEPFCSVECYDFRTNQWYEGPELRSRRRHVGVACLGNCLYAVGGHDGTQHLNTVECYNQKVGRWEYVQPMKTLRRGIAVGVLEGPMYAVGGLDDVNCYRTVERYDPQLDEWTEVASLKSPRGGVGVCTLRKYLYAAGGNDGSTSLQTVEKYDPHTNKWTEVAPMAKRRAGVGLAALNGYIYAVGGFDDASPLDTVERYDPQTDTWQFVQSMNVCRGGVGLAALGGYLAAIGGHDGKAYLNSAEMYNPKNDTWENIASMNTCRAGAGVVTLAASSLNFMNRGMPPTTQKSFGSL